MEKRVIAPVETTTMRLVKSEDLNHHGTLFAGRTAEWFVESGFITVSTFLNPKQVVCLKIHGMHFKTPIKLGKVIKFSSKVVYTGKTSILVFVKVEVPNEKIQVVEGFMTFIHVDEEAKSLPHNIEIKPETAEDIALYNLALEQVNAMKSK